jgi:hypothetical protein
MAQGKKKPSKSVKTEKVFKRVPLRTGARIDDDPPDDDLPDDELLNNEVDGVHYIFGGDPDKEVFIIARSQPAVYQGVSIRGFLDDLTPDTTEKAIASRWGGGTYILQAKCRSTGRILRSKTLEISGSPIISALPGAASLPVAPAPVPDTTMVKIGDVDLPYSGNLEEAQRFFLFIKGAQTLFPEKATLNDRLLEMLLARQQPAMIDSLKEARELADLFGGGGGQSGYMGIIEKSIEQAGGVLKTVLHSGYRTKRPAVAGTPANRPGITRRQAGEVVGEPLAINGHSPVETSASVETETTETEGNVVQEHELVVVISSQLCQAFRLQPAMSEADVVAVLDQFIQQKETGIRVGVVEKYSATVRRMCQLELASEFGQAEAGVGTLDDFNAYLNQVFDLYQHPDRKVVWI